MSITQPDDRVTSYEPVVATTTFAADFPVFDNSDLVVVHNGVERYDFTVQATYEQSISNDARVTFSPGLIGTVLVVGARKSRRSNRFGPGPINANMLNAAFDTAQAELQESRRDINRSVKLSYGDEGLLVEPGNPGDFLIYGPDNNVIPSDPPSGAGNMNTAVYDPQGINSDAFDRSNHTGPNVPDDDSVGDDQVDAISSSKIQHTQPDTGGQALSVAKILSEFLTPQRFGADGNDDADCGPAFIAAKNALLEHGGTLTVPPGRYRSSINLDFTTSYSSYSPEGRISIEGAGANVSQIVYTGVASPTSFLLDMGDDGTGESYNVRSYMRVFGLGLTSLVPNRIGGLCLRRQAYFEIDHLHSFGLSEGLRLESSLTGQVSNSWLQGNRTGGYLLKGARPGAFSSPNALLFSNVVIGENSENGIFADNPGPLTILGGTFESNLNALTILRDATMAGLGPVALNILGATYFEHNSGEADIKISQEGSVAGGLGLYNIMANFNRISSGVKTINNIKIVHNSGKLQANIQSAFAEAGTYVASGAEPYIAVSGVGAAANRRVDDTGSLYQSAVAKPAIEAMQDYEGGTFTPVISNVTTSGATGWFEKRGRFVSGEISFTCTGAASGPLAATLPGLPVPDIFATASGMEVNTTAKAVIGFINAATSSIQGIRFADASSAFANGHVVRVAFRYRCTS